jgi:hypothetical protein
MQILSSAAEAFAGLCLGESVDAFQILLPLVALLMQSKIMVCVSVMTKGGGEKNLSSDLNKIEALFVVEMAEGSRSEPSFNCGCKDGDRSEAMLLFFALRLRLYGDFVGSVVLFFVAVEAVIFPTVRYYTPKEKKKWRKAGYHPPWRCWGCRRF